MSGEAITTVVWKIWPVTGILAGLILDTGMALGAEQRKITAREAADILRDYVWWRYPHLAPRLDLSDFSRYDPDFHYFFVWTLRRPAGVAVGHYAVNPWTGHVWDTIFCELVVWPRSEKWLKRIRKRFRYSDQEYAELAARKPVADCK
jgi:hypothetical protein